MEQQVSIAEVKTRLSHYIREVKSGKNIIITDHRNPVAKIISFQSSAQAAVVSKPDSQSFDELLDEAPCHAQLSKLDALAMLMEDRSQR